MFEQALIDYIKDRSGISDFDAETPLFSGGLLDSMAVLELTAFVERKAGVKFAVSDVILDNLDSVNRILAFVNKHRPG
jgi:acyl carrier protein